MLNNYDVIITKRGKPVAVIVPYEEYERTQRAEGFRKIMEVRVSQGCNWARSPLPGKSPALS